MDRYQETFETWNKVASLYQEKFMDLDLYNESYDFFCNEITKQNASVLEIGCGPGNITKYLLTKRPDFNILGTDIAPNMIALAKKNNPPADFMVMDCRNIGELKTNLDGIICGFCLPYISHEEASKLISDCHQLLSVNGVIYISFVEGNEENSGFRKASTGDRTYFYYHSLEKISGELIRIGFKEPKVFKINYKLSENEKEIHTVLTTMKR